MSQHPTPPPDDAPAKRTNDPEGTMACILEMATVEFADKGLDGARIDAIAAATRTSKRMVCAACMWMGASWFRPLSAPSC